MKMRRNALMTMVILAMISASACAGGGTANNSIVPDNFGESYAAGADSTGSAKSDDAADSGSGSDSASSGKEADGEEEPITIPRIASAGRSDDSARKSTDTVEEGITAEGDAVYNGSADTYEGEYDAEYDIAYEDDAAGEYGIVAGDGDTFGEPEASSGSLEYIGDDEDVLYETSEYDGDIEEVIPQAGLLTAGEWNDNDNWGFFTNLVNSDKISFPSFGLDPRYRIAVNVTDKENKPVVNAVVSLTDESKNALWTAVTNKDGVAYLFSNNADKAAFLTVSDGKTTEEQEVTIDTSIDAASEDLTDTSGDQTQRRDKPKSVNETIDVVFGGESKNYQKTDIMFIVDATGSMSDEMMFLQSEFSAITEEIGTENTRYSVNFYRDEGDDYVTKCFDFTDDIAALQKNLNAEVADGGGDVPEAVDKILTEAVFKSSWDEDSVKIAFLIFDAPPHDGKEAELYAAVEAAAAKGIRIIPVVSSGSERETELFGRAIAIETGGTYVFLTDDSGIGGSHMEPIIGEYKVERLYDIIIRVVNSYKQ